MSSSIVCEAPSPPSSAGTNPFLHRLDEILSSLSSRQLAEAPDSEQLEVRVLVLIEFLNTTFDSIFSEGSEENAFQILTRLNGFIDSISEDQVVVDAICYQLPKSVSRFATVSERCLEMAENIIVSLVRNSNPRDMLAMLCEALSSPDDMFKEPSYFTCLLGGLSQVFMLIQRRGFEHVKTAVPVILRLLKVVSLELSDEDMDLEVLFKKVICIVDSIKDVCDKLEGQNKNRLRALLGLFVFQIMALATMNMRHKVSKSLPLMLQLSRFLPYIGVSYSGLIAGPDVDQLYHLSLEDEEDDCAGCFSHIQHGAALAVIWGYKSADIAISAEADTEVLIKELRLDRTKRWQALGTVKHILASVILPWNMKQQAVDFLVSIMEADTPLTHLDGDVDFKSYTASLYSSLQALQAVIMYAPDAMLRKKAFAVFKQVLLDLPISLRFDILKALVKNSDSSSMTAVLLDLVKEELHSEITKRTSKIGKVLEAGNGADVKACFWSADILQFVEMVLRPPNGGPPSLPDSSYAVLSALNLYRYILITESSGKTNYSGVLREDQLRKAHSEWLLPLRSLVSGIVAETRNTCDELASDLLCGLNPVEFVLYRCIELVEENLKSASG